MNPQIHEVVELLKEALRDDQEAMQLFMDTVTPCTEKYGNHPFIVVNETSRGPQASVLGLINGILDKVFGEKVAVVRDSNTNKVVDFIVYKK